MAFVELHPLTRNRLHEYAILCFYAPFVEALVYGSHGNIRQFMIEHSYSSINTLIAFTDFKGSRDHHIFTFLVFHDLTGNGFLLS